MAAISIRSGVWTALGQSSKTAAAAAATNPPTQIHRQAGRFSRPNSASTRALTAA
jgi:hypothetical protein